MNTSTPLSEMQSIDLTARLDDLARHERRSLVDFLRHLAEFDARKVYAGLGYGSLWVYLTERLRLSSGSAYRRCTSARLLRQYPVIAEFIADGRLTLKRLCLLADVLTPENHLDVLGRASKAKEKEVPLLVAELCPRPDVKDSLRKVPERRTPAQAETPRTSTVEVNASVHVADTACVQGSTITSNVEVDAKPRANEAGRASSTHTSTVEVPRPSPTVAPRRRAEIVPTSATSYALTARVGPEFAAELEQVKAALSHKFPNGDFEEVMRECFRITLEVLERRRLGSDKRPATRAADDSQASKSRHIPKPVQRAVWNRDGGRCAFMSADGKRCGSTHQVQFHHIIPFSRGGRATVENLSLRCRVHNHYEALLDLGPELMAARVPEAKPIPKDQLLPRWKCSSPEAGSSAAWAEAIGVATSTGGSERGP